MFPACCFATTATRLRTRSVTCSLPPSLPAAGKIHACNPLSAPVSRPPAVRQVCAPLWDFHPSGSQLAPILRRGTRLHRKPDAFCSPEAPAINSRLRIIVPGPLLPAGLAVPRTSWNHLHSASKPIFSQTKTHFLRTISAKNISFLILRLDGCECGFRVNKT
jgi:hypothetical protein